MGALRPTYPSDGYALDFRRYAREKSGRLAVEVTARHEAMLLHTARIDVLNQRDQEILAARCAVNGTVATGSHGCNRQLQLEQLAQAPSIPNHSGGAARRAVSHGRARAGAQPDGPYLAQGGASPRRDLWTVRPRRGGVTAVQSAADVLIDGRKFLPPRFS